MAYLPGPLILQDASNVGITTTDYDFTDFTETLLSDVQPTLDGWQSFFDDATLLLDEPEDPYPDVNIDAMQDVLNTYSDPVSIFGVGDLLTAMGVATISLSGAISSAPAEAWQAPTAPFVAPSAVAEIAVPTIAPNSITFNVSNSGGATSPGQPAAGGGVQSGVTITNLTAYGSPNFTLGDQFQVTVTGQPNQDVYVSATLNGVDLGTTLEGNSGNSGVLVITGTIDVASIGVWTQTWTVGLYNVGTLNFVVFDSE